VKWRLCRNARFVWDGFLRQKSVTQTQRSDRAQFNKQPPSDYVIRDWQRRSLATGSVHDRKRSGRPGVSDVWKQSVHRLYEALQNPHTANRMLLAQFVCAPQFFKTPSGLCGHTVHLIAHTSKTCFLSPLIYDTKFYDFFFCTHNQYHSLTRHTFITISHSHIDLKYVY
jgi:hypothetical protein